MQMAQTKRTDLFANGVILKLPLEFFLFSSHSNSFAQVTSLIWAQKTKS